MMLIVATLTALGFYLAQRKVTADAERNLRENFRLNFLRCTSSRIASRSAGRSLQRARRQSRIHAAIEDNAIDLLYPSAKDELRDLMEGQEPPPEQARNRFMQHSIGFWMAQGRPETAESEGSWAAGSQGRSTAVLGEIAGNAADRIPPEKSRRRQRWGC